MQKSGGLWKHRDFMRFWMGQSASQFGNQITALALPTIAILVLHATVFQAGVLGAIEFVAFPAIGLFVGVWVDRFPRKPIMIVCNVGRLVSLSTIPAAYWLNALSLYQLFVVAGVSGVFTVFFDVAYQSYLPSLVEASDLVEGNSKLQTSASAAQVAGPTFAGVLIGILGGAISVVVDIAGYAGSVLAMTSIKRAEPDPRDGAPMSLSFGAELREGVDVILHTRVLATLTLCLTVANLGNTIAQSVYLFFAYNQLHLTPLEVGGIGTVGGVGFLLGSLTASRASKRMGIGRALSFSIFSGIAWVGFPLAALLPSIPTLVLFTFLLYAPVLIFNITALSMMQRVTPSRLLGRVNATRRTISWGVIPLGWVIGGALGATIGLSPTLVIGGIIAGSAALFAVLSPIYHLKEENELDSFTTLRSLPE